MQAQQTVATLEKKIQADNQAIEQQIKLSHFSPYI
jgi:hypothetical protein